MMDRDALRNAVRTGRIEWRKHALQRMLERAMSRADVKEVLCSGELIQGYPEDTPYPSALFLGWVEGEPVHVVAALDTATGTCFVITAYRPDPQHFEADFRTRRPS